MQAKKHEHWSSQWLFVMATVGSSIGLANIWRFPYTTGENGGGAFVLIYLGAAFFLALPLLIAELMLGRRGQEAPPLSLLKIARESAANPRWAWIGYAGVVTATLILSYYCMIGGETFIYAFKNLAGQFVGIDAETSRAISNAYNASLPMVFFGHLLFVAIMVWISAQGVSRGLERAIRYLMPTLFLILLGMVIYAAMAGSFGRTLNYLFSPDFSRINIDVVVDAFGQAFFSVGIGATVLMAYGSYMHRRDSLVNASIVVVSADTLVAMLAGLAIFPIVFAYGLDPAGGPALVFETIPLAFGHMPGGRIFGTGFFILIGIAAMTSAISLLEAPVAWLSSKDNWSRKQAALAAGAVVLVLGVLPILSVNRLADFHPLGAFGVDRTFFDLFDYMASNILLPVGGLLIAVFVGWVVPRHITGEELRVLKTHHWFRAWLFILRYVVTLILLVVFINLIMSL